MMIFNDEAKYFNWLCSFFSNKDKYWNLLTDLYNKEFVYIFVMDGNRAEDGINLRYRFEREFNYLPGSVTGYFGSRSCSVLEMMVALGLRCEETIMTDDHYGNRTSYWLNSMISSLGLYTFTDDNYDHDSVDYILDRFLNRQYKPNGEGGLFVVNDRSVNMRSIEIWTQMNWYLNNYI